jgi:hypothetical protein
MRIGLEMRHRFPCAVGRALVGAALSLIVTQAWAQEAPPRPTVPGAETLPRPEDSAPPIAAYPAELLQLLAPPAERGPVTLRPSIGVSEEYNDNVNLDNQARQWDFITRLTPGLTLTVNRPSYQLRAGYTISGEVYANESRLNDTHKEQAFVATGLYQPARGVTVTVGDFFALSRSTNQVGTQGFSVGQQETWSNTFAAGTAWDMTPRDSLSLGLTFTVQRFLASPAASTVSTASTGSSVAPGIDSNVYGLRTGLEHALTRRLTGIVGYGFTYADFLGQSDNSTTHVPTVGARYALTPTLTGFVTGGPAITELGGETFVTPAINARLVQLFQIGTVSLGYSRDVGVAGGLGGPNDTQVFSAGLILPTWYRNLVVAFNPSYRMAKSVSHQQPSQIGQQSSQLDAKSLTIPVVVSYQLARYTAVFAEYTFFQQRTGGSSSTTTGGSSTAQPDIDQNRLRFGLQFGYPFNFD